MEKLGYLGTMVLILAPSVTYFALIAPKLISELSVALAFVLPAWSVLLDVAVLSLTCFIDPGFLPKAKSNADVTVPPDCEFCSLAVRLTRQINFITRLRKALLCLAHGVARASTTDHRVHRIAQRVTTALRILTVCTRTQRS
jgi:hypothetical protein